VQDGPHVQGDVREPVHPATVEAQKVVLNPTKSRATQASPWGVVTEVAYE
jgi:hypothetical protein